MTSRLLLITLAMIASAQFAQAMDVERTNVQAFIDNMVEEHSYDRATLLNALQEAESKQSILDAISKPAEKTLTWQEYRNIFLKEKRIKAGADFWREHAADLQRISQETGVSREMLVGIIGVETYFGRITGSYRVLDALATLAFDYPRRSKFFTRELEQYLLLIREEGMDVADATGSYAGAMGSPQFMPSSYRAYAVDSSGDGKRDIWGNWQDVIGSVANYFVEHGWQADNDVVSQASLGPAWNGSPPENILKATETVDSLSNQGVMFTTNMPGDHESQLLTLEGVDDDEHWVGFHNFFVITRYNRSVMYALAAHQLGQEIALEVARDES